MKSWPKPARHWADTLAASVILFKFNWRASSARTRIAKRIIEAERLGPFQLEPARVFGFDPTQDFLRVGDRPAFQNRQERGAGVFDVNIDLPRDQRLVRQIAAQIETAHNLEAGLPFNRLRENFTENHLLGKVFRAHRDRAGALAREEIRHDNDAR